MSGENGVGKDSVPISCVRSSVLFLKCPAALCRNGETHLASHHIGFGPFEIC